MEYSSKHAYEHQFHRHFVCVVYPGIVRNPDRMMETLGGIREISTTFGQEKRRLELRFRPDCIYSKPAYGDGRPTTGLVLKVKVQRRKSQPDYRSINSVRIMGCVRRCYNFDSLCDFQQLPAFRMPTSGKVECVYNEIVPKGVNTASPLEKPTSIPFFLPPVSFSRNDTMNTFVLREPKKARISSMDGCYRRRRQKHGIYNTFSLTDPIPEKATVQAQHMLTTKVITGGDVEKVRAAFKVRPIWTKNALININKLEFSTQTLGVILPSIAFYYVNGPWRGTWVRYGYDPRKHFEARVYQLLDFRVRAIGSVHECIKIKRLSLTKVNYRMAESVSQYKDDEQNFVNSTFDEDTVPPYRVIFYQYCDIHLKKVQDMLKKVPSPKNGTVCDERNGWLPYRFDDQCRNIMMEIVLNNIRRLSEENPEVCSAMESVEDDEDEEGDEGEMSGFEEDEEEEIEGIIDSMDDFIFPMELIQDYEQQYAVQTAEITAQIGRIAVASGAERNKLISDIDRQLEESQELLEQIGLEIRDIPQNSRAAYTSRLNCYQAEWKRLQQEFNNAKVARSKAGYDSSVDDFDEIGIQEDQKRRLLDNTERLERTSNYLNDAYRVTIETEQIGTQVLADLSQQRESIQRSRGRYLFLDIVIICCDDSWYIIDETVQQLKMATQFLNRIGQLGLGVAVIGGVVNSALYNVDGGHRAVIFDRFSGVKQQVTGEGTHFFVPWVQRPIIFDIRSQPRNVPVVTGSKDLQNVNITLRILFRPVPDQLPKIYTILGQDYDERVLPSITTEVLKAVVAQFDAGELITQREMVSQKVSDDLTERAAQFGVILDDISITHLTFGKEFTQAVEMKQVAQQDAEKARFLVEKAEQMKQAAIITAEGDASAAQMLARSLKESGDGLIELRRIEAAEDIAYQMSRARGVSYLPAGQQTLLSLPQ
uniref:Band 7 domain-containing protein n=1 Tax=Anopheles minimus TaxID=112268 RepID=A0A182VUL0_9DIPT